MFNELTPPPPFLGPTIGGLGAQKAIELAAARPQKTILASRTKSRVEQVIEAIKKRNSNINVMFVKLGPAETASV